MSHWSLPQPTEHLSVPCRWLEGSGQKGTSLTVAENIHTSDDSGLITRKHPELFSNLHNPTAYPTGRRHTGALTLVHI